MTPTFSAYVVVPEPPKQPAKVVATPSASKASPARSSMLRPVIAETALTCPTFSAMSTMMTGRVTKMTEGSNEGVWKVGKPIHGASAIACSAPSERLPVAAAKTHPMITPIRMPSLDTIPRPATVQMRMEKSVTVATRGELEKFVAAVGARLSPMRAPMAPVTVGGMTASRTFFPAALTTKPTTMSRAPVTTTPPKRADIVSPAVAVSGAMNAKELPR